MQLFDLIIGFLIEYIYINYRRTSLDYWQDFTDIPPHQMKTNIKISCDYSDSSIWYSEYVALLLYTGILSVWGYLAID